MTFSQKQEKVIEKRLQSLLAADPWLKPFQSALRSRISAIRTAEYTMTGGRRELADIARGHQYFGLHFADSQWIFREWAPNATAIHLIGEKTGWQKISGYALEKISDEGVWEIRLAAESLSHGDLYRLHLEWPGGGGDRIPAYAGRVVQDPQTLIFNAQVWRPPAYQWTSAPLAAAPSPLLIYEAHVGMAQEEGKVGTFLEFA